MTVEEKLKEAIKADAFYIEPKDQNIVYLNLSRLENTFQICNKALEMQREECAEKIGDYLLNVKNCEFIQTFNFVDKINFASIVFTIAARETLNAPQPTFKE